MAGEIVEFFGEPSSGKTELMLQSAFHISSTTNFKTIFVDSGQSIYPKRIRRTVSSSVLYSAQLDEIFQQIRVRKAFDVHDLVKFLSSLHSDLSQKEKYSDVRLLIIDSFASIVSPILGKDNAQSIISELSFLLKSISLDFSIAVLIVNHCTTNDCGQHVPCLGKVWSHVPHHSIIVTRPTNIYSLKTSLRLHKSCRLPRTVVNYSNSIPDQN